MLDNKPVLENIYSQLIDNIMAKLPAFFEKLIVDLLLKMGYGYDKNSGIVSQQSLKIYKVDNSYFE